MNKVVNYKDRIVGQNGWKSRQKYLCGTDAKKPLFLCDEIGRMSKTMRTKFKRA